MFSKNVLQINYNNLMFLTFSDFLTTPVNSTSPSICQQTPTTCQHSCSVVDLWHYCCQSLLSCFGCAISKPKLVKKIKYDKYIHGITVLDKYNMYIHVYGVNLLDKYSMYIHVHGVNVLDKYGMYIYVHGLTVLDIF